MTLREKRVLFTRLSAKLVEQAFKLGFEAAWDQVMRTDEQAIINSLGANGRMRVALLIEAEFPGLAVALTNNGNSKGIVTSLHRDGLAADLILYRDGKYLTRTEDYKPLGEWWEKQNELCRWGGRFNDGNHFSITHNGRA